MTLKIGSMVNTPMADKAPTKITDSINAPVPNSFAMCESPAPKYLAINAEVPIPNPILRLMTVNVTGKVKLIAANSSVPNKLIKNVSTKLKDISIIMPTITGIVICFNVNGILPFTKSWLRFDNVRIHSLNIIKHNKKDAHNTGFIGIRL